MASFALPAKKLRPHRRKTFTFRPKGPATRPLATWCWWKLKKARHGDPGPRGEIVEIVERQTSQFVGTYFESAGAAYVQIDGGLFAQPIYVGDPGAKNARPDDKVVLEMVRFPSPLHEGEGVITEVLGPRGKPGVDTLSIIREFNLPEQFADDALHEARQQAETFDEAVGERPISPARRSSRSIRWTRGISTTRFRWCGSTTAVGGWAFTLPTFPISCGRTGPGPRGPGAGHERLSARPRAAHAARGDLQRPGESSAGQGPLYQVGRDGIYARGLADLDRTVLGGHPQQQTARLTSRWTNSSSDGPRAAPQTRAARSATCSSRMHALAMIAPRAG